MACVNRYSTSKPLRFTAQGIGLKLTYRYDVDELGQSVEIYLDSRVSVS